MHQRLIVPALALLLAVTVAGPARGQTLNGFDLSDSLIPPGAIESGGPPRDGIPAIDRPRFLPAAEATFLDAEDRVLGVNVMDQAKAYPIEILNWHEIVNDESAGQNCVVTYCPLCGTGMVFATNVGDQDLIVVWNEKALSAHA